MPENATPEIERILARLEAIEQERMRLGSDADARREELMKEEHELDTRLTELQDAASRPGTAMERAAAQTEITRTPRLPG